MGRDTMQNTTCFLLFVALMASCCVADVCTDGLGKKACDDYKSAYDLDMSACDGNNACEDGIQNGCESGVDIIAKTYSCECPDDTCSGAFSSYQSLSMMIFLFIGKIFIE